jgi:glutamate-1-semialdehyde 2,1-aminomutase
VTIGETYVERTPESLRLTARAERVMPGGDTRAAGFHRPYPLTMAGGDGAHLTDVDGHHYWDLSSNFTSLVHGHQYPPIVEAIQRSARTGGSWPARNVEQLELAETMVDRVASVEQVRFCNSGSEATMLAMQLSRVVTGRSAILMARFGYHGAHEIFERATFDGQIHVPGPNMTFMADYGDADAFEAILDEHGPDIAAVFLEPVMGAGGIVSAPPEFYRRVAQRAREVGALFVFDEVISFRLAVSGYQSVLGIASDLTTFAKVIGGGFPAGALGGRAELMERFDPRAGKMYHSGTFNGNPMTCAAGVVSVKELTAERIGEMDRLGARLEASLVVAAQRAGLAFSCRRVGSLMNIYLLDALPSSNSARTDGSLMSRLHLAGMNHGLYFASRGMLVLSTVMDDAAIDDISERFLAAFGDVAAEL